MLNHLIQLLVRSFLWLRYRVRVEGAEAIAARGRRGILFLPNHPAMIDPVILVTSLWLWFQPRPLADESQVNRPGLRWLTRRVRALPIPDVRSEGPQVRAAAAEAIERCAAALAAGDNIVLYPSGHLYRSRREDLRGNSAVQTLLARVGPELRVVLVRTHGLWGSSFSMVSGRVPALPALLRRAALIVLRNLLFFVPRREVRLELHEPADLPRDAGRNELNEYLERFYNADAPPARYVPYDWWERGGVRELPDPEQGISDAALSDVPDSVRERVYAELRRMAQIETLQDSDRLAHDLGLDSLMRAELVLWLGKEFGAAAVDPDALQTVGDVLLATRGESVGRHAVELRPPSARWFGQNDERAAAVAAGDSVNAVFLAQARARAGQVVAADQSGERTYRDLLTGIFALRPHFARLPGERLAILLPASVAAVVSYLTTLFVGRTPVLLNWTTGARNVEHALTLTGCERIITSRRLLDRLAQQGLDVAALQPRCVFLEDLSRAMGWGAKLLAALRARFDAGSLGRVAAPPHAAVLLTSGSEALPKAVPLTHVNVLTNIRDVLSSIHIRRDDRLIGFLPPFHSFGLTIAVLTPLLAGLRAVYHPNPTETWALARLIEQYRVTVLLGTPTFLSALVRAATRNQLAPLRLAITGAERCPERTYQAVAERAPQACILEGYGVTECSPVISANRAHNARHGTIGQVLPSLEYAIVDPEGDSATPAGGTGMLLVRGPTVFSGYLGTGAASPFVEWNGRSWYRTGDLVSADADGVLTFRGRLKRFVKIAGEMISLPAIEAVLEREYARDDDEGPVVAIEAGADENHPEVVLFTTLDLERQTVNRQIRDAGLSPLHNVARVERVESIPLLGTGKTDYRALKARLK